MPESGRIVISNTTPIISLATIGKLDLLQKLYGEICVPVAVKAELLAGGSRFGASEVQTAAYIHTYPINP